jgi:uncharacterized protein
MSVFNGLESMGINNINLDIYKKEEKQKINKDEEKQKMMDSLYNKELVCPVCNRKIKLKFVKSAAIKIEKKDSDFMIYYRGINPLFYEVLFCNGCGYANLGDNFSKISERSIENIHKNISSVWKQTNFPEEYNIDVAIQLHKLALLNAVVKEDKSSVKALICLKLSWLYRLSEDNENEKRFQEQTLQGFLDAYSNESFPIAGLDQFSLLYLIGELYKRLDDEDKALKYFSDVIISRASEKIKDMARNQKDLIRNK